MPARTPLFRFCSALGAIALSAMSSAASTPAPDSAPLGKIAFELIDNRIFVNVMINGHGPFHMILDTGASLAVSPEAAQKAGLIAAGTSVTGGVGEKSVEAQNSHVRDLTLGPVRFQISIATSSPPPILSTSSAKFRWMDFSARKYLRSMSSATTIRRES